MPISRLSGCGIIREAAITMLSGQVKLNMLIMKKKVKNIFKESNAISEVN